MVMPIISAVEFLNPSLIVVRIKVFNVLSQWPHHFITGPVSIDIINALGLCHSKLNKNSMANVENKRGISVKSSLAELEWQLGDK